MAFSNPNLLDANASTFENNSHTWVSTGGNTTLAVVSGQFLSGTYSLRATATAAGSVEMISPRWLVTEGLEYVARIPTRISSVAAGKVATARITWFDAPSGGNSLGVSDATMTLPNLGGTGWWWNNYSAVVGKAPVGAKSATLKLTMAGLAAAEYINIDDVYAGAALVRPNNLYSYAVASMEQDVSAWKLDTGSKVKGNWNLSAGMGFFALEVTSTEIAEIPIRTEAYVPITPGAEYTGYALVRNKDVAVQWRTEIRWYKDSATLVGTSTQTTWDVAANVTQWVGMTAVAPPDATKCKLFLIPIATAVGQVFALEDVWFGVSPNVPGNFLSYVEYSSEGVLPDYTLSTGAASLYQLSSAILDGYFVVRADLPAPGLITAQLNRLIPVTVGTTYQVGATIYRHSLSNTETVSAAVRTRIDWFDADGNLFMADNADQFYSAESSAYWYSQTNTETRTCPEGAVYAKVGWEVTSDNPLVDFFAVDKVHFIEAEAEYTLETSNETGCVTLTVANPYAPSANNSNLTITRVDENGKSWSMRSYGRTWDLAPNPYSTLVIEDYEAPLGGRVWYSVAWTSNTGATRGPRLFTATVNAPVLADADYAWFKSPGVPALNTTVMMEAPLKWARQARSTRYDIVGRKNPVHVTGIRSGRTSSITVLVWDPEDNALFDSLLDAGTPALVQAMPGYGIEGNLYVSIGDVECEPLDPDARVPGWRWSLSITEVDRPDGGLQGSAASTWQAILDSSAYPTWEELFNAHETWTDVLTEG